MCYTIEQRLEMAMKRAKYWNDERNIKRIEELLRKFENKYNASGFAHPDIIAYSNEKPHEPVLFTWGLIPSWAKTEKDAKNIWNKTINARGETLFEKPSFRDAATHKRCIIPVNGFYEHHHHKGNKYPFYIKRKDNEPVNLAGIWSEWTNQETGEFFQTCSVVTTKANTMMAKIHNNPKLNEARMPIILTDGKEDAWLQTVGKKMDQEVLQQFLIPFPEQKLKAYTVRKLSGKDSPGNVPEASEEYVYDELEM
ncbi:MAG: SOS response-associated peptidase [Marinilabiliales bacterium]|nr:MAG: SOS response-associated peptidase [Marinilabiliales bacterium]